MSKFMMCFLCLFFSLPATSDTDIRKLSPIEQKRLLKFEKMDESSTDPTFSKFRKRILVAIKDKDVKFISSILARDASDFLQKYKLDKDPLQSNVWDQLNRAISAGCAKGHANHFGCPYVNRIWPRYFLSDTLSTTDGAFTAILAEKSEIKSHPDANSKTIGYLGLEIVQMAELVGDEVWRDKWVKVKPIGGPEGYVSTKDTFDQTATFEKTGNGWKLVKFRY